MFHIGINFNLLIVWRQTRFFLQAYVWPVTRIKFENPSISITKYGICKCGSVRPRITFALWNSCNISVTLSLPSTIVKPRSLKNVRTWHYFSLCVFECDFYQGRSQDSKILVDRGFSKIYLCINQL